MKYVLPIIISLGVSAWGTAQVDDHVKERFADDYRAARVKIEAAFGSFEVKTHRADVQPAGGRVRVFELTHRFRGNCCATVGTATLCEADQVTPVRETRWGGQVSNSKYGFDLLKDGDTYKLTKLMMYDSPERPLDIIGALYSIHELAIPFTQLHQEPGFVFEKYEDIQYGGRAAKELIVSRRLSAKVAKRYTAIFVPELAWACVSLKTWTSERPEEELETLAVFDGPANDLPVPTAFDLIAHQNGVKKLLVHSAVTEFRRLPPQDESEFTLSHYGLPEPNGVTWERPAGRNYWYVLAAAVGLLAVSFAITAWVRRRRGKTAGAAS